MGSSDKVNRQRSLHQILGGGFVADVVLWRRKDVTVGILVVTLFAWVVFERPAPPLPHLYLSEEMASEVAYFIRNHINMLLLVSENIALGKDTNMFLKVSGGLILVSVLGGLTDFLTLGYTSILIVLTVPPLYEKYEDQVDAYVLMAYRRLWQLYHKFDAVCVSKSPRLSLEMKKLS